MYFEKGRIYKRGGNGYKEILFKYFSYCLKVNKERWGWREDCSFFFVRGEKKGDGYFIFI